jgi:hypothetical protein
MSEQPETGEHFCTGCGQPHGGEHRADPGVEIARIQAERDVKIAQLEYRQDQEAGILAAETAVEVTELETEAELVEAVATAETLAEAAGPPEAEPAPVTIEAPEPAGPAEDEVLPPPPKEHEHSGGYGSSAWFSGR